MKSIYIFISFLILSMALSASAGEKKTPTKISAEQKKAIELEFKKPAFMVKMMNSTSNRWALLNILRKHLPPADYRSLKLKGDSLALNYKSKLKINLLDNNRFYLSDKNKVYTFGSDKKSILVSGLTLKIVRTQSFIWNYKAIESQLNTIAALNHLCPLLLPCASAAEPTDSTGYDLVTLLYYMDVNDNGDSVMWDYFIEEPAVKNAIGRLNKSGKTISSIDCDSLGMTFRYSDGTVSYLTTNGKQGDDFAITMSETNNAGGPERAVDGIDRSVSGNALFYYCQKLSASRKDELKDMINMNLINPTVMEGTDVSK